MKKNDTAKTICPRNRHQWREWLVANHAKERSVWLLCHSVESGQESVRYSDAVDEALCFGWIDGKVQPIDKNQHRQLFTVRKPKSVWSRANKEKAADLIEEGRMTEAGLISIERARRNGSWILLDQTEGLVLPDALRQAFAAHAEAEAYFQTLSHTTRRNVLQWIALAKRPQTIQKRVLAVVHAALAGTVPLPFYARKQTAGRPLTP